MRAGKIEQIDKPDIIYSAPTTAFVAGFIGLTNKVPGQASGGNVSVLGSNVPMLPGSPASGPVTALVRPEAIRFTPSASGNGLATATVLASSFLGAHGRVQARLADGNILLAQMSVGETVALQPGEVVDVAIAPSPVLATA